MTRRAAVAAALLILVTAGAPGAHAASIPPERAAALIQTLLQWAVEGRALPGDPQSAPLSLPHRMCGGRLDPEHLPATIYVSWQLSAEGQHAAVNWKYDVASKVTVPLSADEAADAGKRIAAGGIPQEERAFVHAVTHRDGTVTTTVGYCWGSAKGTFAFKPEGPVLTDVLQVHGY